MPGLESFCVCTAIGLGSIYLLQISWFVAWMSLDERRIASGHDGLLPCIVHEDFKPTACSQKTYGDVIVKKYAWLLSSVVFQFVVILFTIGMLAFGIWGSILIQQKFDLASLIPSDSYLKEFLSLRNKFYPNKGWTADIYTAGFDYTDLHKFEDLTNQLNDLQISKTHLGGKNFLYT